MRLLLSTVTRGSLRSSGVTLLLFSEGGDQVIEIQAQPISHLFEGFEGGRSCAFEVVRPDGAIDPGQSMQL